MQPLDVVFIFALKKYYGPEIEMRVSSNPNLVVTSDVDLRLFGPALPS
jgi:hypothetical protein